MLQDDIIKLIVDAGLATAGTDLVSGGLPEEPISGYAIAVKQYGGADSVRAMGPSKSNTKLRRPRVQVAVRHPDQQLAWTKAQAIRNELGDFDGTVNGVAYHDIVPIGDLGEIAEDGNLGYRVVGSYEAVRDP